MPEMVRPHLRISPISAKIRYGMWVLQEAHVIPGAEYVLVDDVTNLGGTLAELANFIQIYGGVIKRVLVLVNAGRDTALVPQKKFV
jgi:adenine/guanine phosphoribosyltransferase-like PRPP-binding protein